MASEAATPECPKSVQDWIPVPAPLDGHLRGERAVFSDNDCVVERREPDVIDSNCVCYTAKPLLVEQVWQITVLHKTTRWLDAMVSTGSKLPAPTCFLSIIIMF